MLILFPLITWCVAPVHQCILAPPPAPCSWSDCLCNVCSSFLVFSVSLYFCIFLCFVRLIIALGVQIIFDYSFMDFVPYLVFFGSSYVVSCLNVCPWSWYLMWVLLCFQKHHTVEWLGSILTRPFSTSLVVMTMTLVFSCHTICQKSFTVVAKHPWVAM